MKRKLYTEVAEKTALRSTALAVNESIPESEDVVITWAPAKGKKKPRSNESKMTKLEHDFTYTYNFRCALLSIKLNLEI